MSTRKGELRVNVISARGLRDTAIFGIQDPYVQVGSTEVDLSDVFANNHEEVSAPLFTRDGRQKGEVQLAFTFQPFDPSSCSPHDSQSNLAAFQAQHSSSSSRPGSARTTADSSLENSSLKHRAMPETAVVSELPRDDGLGPLGQSFMTLAMTHITPSKPDLAESLDDHKYLKLAADAQGTSESPRLMPSAPTQTPQSGAVPEPMQPVQPQKCNFYPEEASDEEVEMPAQANYASSTEPLPVMPIEFRCQQPNAESAAVSASACTLDNGSYSSQEVYHAYSTRQSDGSGHALSYGAHRGEGQGCEQQPQVPQWRLMGTSPLHDGQQHAQGQHGGQGSEQQPQSQGQGRDQQPQVPQWRLMGTSPLHEGQRQSQEQPQAQFQVPWQSAGQGIQQQAQAYPHGQGKQQQASRPDWHLMGTAPLHDAYSASESAPRTSLSFSHQNKGSVVRPLTYASMAVGSWSDKAKRCGTAASQTSTSQDDLRVQPSAPSLPSFVSTDQPLSSSGGQTFRGFTNVTQSHDSKQKLPFEGRTGGRPPLGGRSSPTPVPGEHWAPIPFSDLGIDRKLCLTGTNHDYKSVI
ncbi:MAG: hypothetical protein FRX49_10899 [Trebouxia sp. A1-2]|nr:MAG: hypothetical protein FRX49_10899 [Trebouxia sp. A1-2]